MYCNNCGQQMPDTSNWCPACAAPVTVRPEIGLRNVAGASGGAAPADLQPSVPSLSKQIGTEVNARSRDAWAAAKTFMKSPVGGLPEAFAMFDPERAAQVGFAFAILYVAMLAGGTYLLFNRTVNSLGAGELLSMLRGSSPMQDVRIGNLIKLAIMGLVPFASLAGASFLARKGFQGAGSVSGDVFVAGASLLPWGLAVLLAGVVGLGNIELIGALLVFALAYHILILYAGCSRVSGVPESGAAPAVPLMFLLSVWLTKVIVVAIF